LDHAVTREQLHEAQREAELRSRQGFVPIVGKTESGKTILALSTGTLYIFEGGTRRNFEKKPKSKAGRRQRRQILAYARAALAEINPVLAAEAAKETQEETP